MSLRPLEQAENIYVTRPLLPALQEYIARLESIWESQWLTNNGHQHQTLEARLREHIDIPHAVLCNNGTIAWIIGLKSLQLSGEVIVTPFTFPGTIHALLWLGLIPVFVDIDPITLTIDPKKIEEKITSRTSAIAGVHLYGIPCDVLAIEALAAKHHLKVAYDGAHAFGLSYKEKSIAHYGDITMLSFHATKLFHTAEGGALLFRSPELLPVTQQLRNFGLLNENEVDLPGINGKMNELQAALGHCVLDHLAVEYDLRAQLAELYRAELEAIPGITLMPKMPDVRPSLQYFAIRINRQRFGISRDEVLARLREHKIIARRYFYPLCSNIEVYKAYRGAHPSELPIANIAAEEILCLPFYGSLSSLIAQNICTLIRSSCCNF